MVDPAASQAIEAQAAVIPPDAPQTAVVQGESIYVRVKRNKSTWFIVCNTGDTLLHLHKLMLAAMNPTKTAKEYKCHVAAGGEVLAIPEDPAKIRLYAGPTMTTTSGYTATSKQAPQLTQLTQMESTLSQLNITNDTILVLCLMVSDNKYEQPNVVPPEPLES